MKIRAVILAGGEGTRLGVLTAKRTKPAVLFAGKYRIIDFTLSNCVNSQIFDVMVLAQYRPQSLIEHIGSGNPWDLNLDFTGGVRILTPYKAPTADWFIGTADAVQQNFSFIKKGDPDHILILSGDHIYAMDYQKMIQAHIEKDADVTVACIQVPIEDASRFGIIHYDEDLRVDEFLEKPINPPSNTANMGIYLFKQSVLNKALWDDHTRPNSNHDFGKDIIPSLIEKNNRVFAYPFTDYWVDVGTIEAYWQAHMDLLKDPPDFQLYRPDWVIHTRSYERAPTFIHKDAKIENSLISDGCILEPGCQVQNSVLSAGVHIHRNSIVKESVLLTDCVIMDESKIFRCVADKRVKFGKKSRIGTDDSPHQKITVIGKDTTLPDEIEVESGALIGTDVIIADFSTNIIRAGEIIQTNRMPHER